MLFDNNKSEEFDVFPLRFWNLFDRCKNDYRRVEQQNTGAEYFHFIMSRYFETETLKDLDIRTIIDKIKIMEDECAPMLEPGAGKENKIKYKFYPLETYQMKAFFQDKKEKEFIESKTSIVLSDDEEAFMSQMTTI